jgi:hypothetical protein
LGLNELLITCFVFIYGSKLWQNPKPRYGKKACGRQFPVKGVKASVKKLGAIKNPGGLTIGA